MAAMRALDEPMPQVGIFWYDFDDRSFFGVCKQELTPKCIEDWAAAGVRTIHFETLDSDKHTIIHRTNCSLPIKSKNQEGDYLKKVGGRVAWNIDKFIVFVGQWAKPIEDELYQMIEKEFALPYFEFVYDEHWDLGHGWSGDM